METAHGGPKDTWFGGWRYNASVNTGTDKIQAVADFNGDGRDDILISSSWGLGILTFDPSTSTLTSLATCPVGTRFPLLGDPNQGWLYNADAIAGVGKFNDDARSDIVITSPWGIGLLTLENNALNCLMLQPKGTRFGGWLYGDADKIQGIGRFNGDTRDDILMTSPWGIGLLTLQDNTFTSLMLQPRNTWFGGWRHTEADKVQAIADFNGDTRADVLVSSGWGLGVLTLSGNTMISLMAQPNGTRFAGGWLLSTLDNTFPGTGDFDNNGRSDLLISSPWGKGLLTLSGNTFSALDMKPYQSPLGKWHLQSRDVIVAVGNFDRQAGTDVLIQKKTTSVSSSRTSTAGDAGPAKHTPKCNR
jgi:ribosome modulation factor